MGCSAFPWILPMNSYIETCTKFEDSAIKILHDQWLIQVYDTICFQYATIFLKIVIVSTDIYEGQSFIYVLT